LTNPSVYYVYIGQQNNHMSKWYKTQCRCTPVY